jgi:inhibitor of KinA
LFFEPHNIERDRAAAWLQESADADTDEAFLAQLAARPIVVLPVWYHPSVAPDLEWLAEENGFSVDTVIDLHSDPTYFAYATGFAPGFCYLGTTSPKLAVPRLATPRSEVPAGSVALADQQTAVYPGPSPGGWRLIGSCPLRLFNLKTAPPALLTIGDSVRFEPVSESEFRALGGSG